LLVAAAVVWNLVNLRAETVGVPYLDDSSIHEQMVRVATELIRGGHLPLTSWFPYLGLGSPQFLHYQSLPAMVTGLAGVLVGPDLAFRWSLYLLLSLWPVSVYLGARLLGARRAAAAAAAAMSPFLVSVPGIGYEQHAYLWIGFGVWTQLWASMTLPLAWGFSWRAIRTGRGWFPAVLFVSLTVALHFETGYLALIPLLLWPFVAGPTILLRVRRSALIAVGSLLASAWVIVPLLVDRQWAATNEVLRGTPLENGYGVGRVLGWLASGQLLDHGRLPVITVFAALGLVLACASWRRNLDGRAVLVVLGACLLLSFGRTTFGAVVDAIPGSGDIFFRRFMMGVQLSALFLAGGGAAWCGQAIWAKLESLLARRGTGPEGKRLTSGPVRIVLAFAAVILVLAPAWSQLGSYDSHNATSIDAQRRADAAQGGEIDQLISAIKAGGGGRVYAGMPSNWGANFTVGSVPVFKYLESRDVDEVGYTLRTASLMTDPEYFFDEGNPSDYQLFGIRYLIIPSGYLPPVPARRKLQVGPYSLWTIDGNGYVQVGRVVGELDADRTNIGVRSIPLLRSHLPQNGDYLRVEFGHSAHAAPSLHSESPRPAVGTVTSEAADLAAGHVAATVTMHQPGVVVLSASYDPGWTVTVDGRPQATEMVAPALVGTRVPAGQHTVVFGYRGFSGYPLLFALGGLVLIAMLWLDYGRRRSRAHVVT
jgi:hypothetical protein